MKRITQLLTILTVFGTMAACNIDTALAEEVVRLQEELTSAQEKINTLESGSKATDASGLIHTVYFWLKDDITKEQIADFKKGVASLSKIETIEKFYVGEHADTEARDVIDHSYDYSLIVHFRDQAGHDAYQPHPVHEKFVATYGPFFEKVIVYDSLVE